MAYAQIIRLTKAVFIKAPNGGYTLEDTGIKMWPAGAEINPNEQLLGELDKAGVEYDVLLQCNEEDFQEALKKVLGL